MQVLFAVIDDLFQFAYRALFGVIDASPSTSKYAMLPAHSATVQPTLPSFSSVAQLLEDRTQSVEAVLKEDASYFIGEENVFLFYEAVFAFDSAISKRCCPSLSIA